MDEAVWLYTDHSEQKNDTFLKFQYIGLLVGLIIILYAFVMTKEIIEHLEHFVQKAKELAQSDLSTLTKHNVNLSSHSEDELKEASSHISQFVYKVNQAMQESEEALKKAESAVSQLQQIALDVEDAIDEMGIDENEKKRSIKMSMPQRILQFNRLKILFMSIKCFKSSKKLKSDG